MRRWLLPALLAAAWLAIGAAPAAAHPLGNFSVNHLTQVQIDAGTVQLRYILDQAEIPTFQERHLSDAEILERKRAEVARRLLVTVDGQAAELSFGKDATITHPPGQGGLRVTRVEFPISVAAPSAARVTIDDATFPGRVGWKAIVPRAGQGTAVSTRTPTGDPTDGLRRYPQDLLSSPFDERQATFSVREGDGTLRAPAGRDGGATTTARGGDDGFAGVFDRASQGEGVLLFLLLAAFGWGALHALSPGHGKGMVAAYLVGTRGTARHAVALGWIVTLTHTAGVFALGIVTLLLSQYVLPEDLYPWLTLASGLLIMVIGGGVLRSRWRAARGRGHGHHDHDHGHHDHDHGHHDHDHGHHGHHDHDHSHALPERITSRGLLAMGASAGMIPCPSALVVLLGAVAQHELVLGLVLIVAFSLGLAATLVALGLAVVWASGLTARLSFDGPLALALPTLSAVVIVTAGLVVTARAIPTLS